MPNEDHEPPAVHIVIARIAERRHSAQAHTVLDGVVEFAIGHRLRILLAHIWRTRIHRLAVHGVTAAIVGMAGSTVVCPVRHPFVNDVRSDCHKVPHRLVARWNRHVTHSHCERSFNRTRRGACAEAAMYHPARIESTADYDEQETSGNDKKYSLHLVYSCAPPV